MNVYMNARAPYKLSTEQRASLNHDPKILQLKQTVKSWSEKILTLARKPEKKQ